MKTTREMKLQLFAGVTKSADINVKAREIDFVSTFGKDVSALMDVLGIARLIKKENGSTLKRKKASGTLESGNVGEGESIPLSNYTVEEVPFGKIAIEKYRKGVSIEAIADKGYEAAVQMTDDEFVADLQAVVRDDFYNSLKGGSLTGHATTWQASVGKAIGLVKDKFKKMHKSTTGVAVWVNTLDVYDYLGGAGITTQTAFGMEYIKNFMGADVMFISSEIDANTVIATPLNNLIGYYVDPSDSEFVKAGLSYTTDSDTGVIGFHIEGNYDRAISDMFAILGLRVIAEYVDGIAHVAVGSSDSQTLGTLTIKSVAGSETGTSKLTVEEGLCGVGNSYKIKNASGTAPTVAYGDNVRNWPNWDGESDYTVASGNKITVVECDSNYKAIKSGTATAVAKA